MCKKAFSLIELSIAILTIGILVTGITQGSRIISGTKLKTARNLTNSSPVVSMSGLVLWLDVTDETTIATGTLASNSYTKPNDNADVVKWRDRNTQQTTTDQKELAATLDTNRPKYIANGIGGLPTLQFDGNSDYLKNATGVISAGKTDYTMVAVWQARVIGQKIIFAQDGGGCSGVNAGILLENGGFFGSWSCGFGWDYIPGVYKATIPYVSIVKINKNKTNKITTYVNGATQSGSPTNGTPTLVNGSVVIGSIATGAAFFDGYISEVIIFDRAITNVEVAGIQEYLSRKYSIKLN